MLKKIADLILFGSIFISLCAVALCIETSLLLQLPLNNVNFYLFVFSATLLQYNLHYLFKSNAIKGSVRYSWSQKNKSAHKVLIACALVLIIISLFWFHPRHLITLCILGVIAVMYSFPVLPFSKKRIKDFGLLKIITLALLWTIVTVWLPADTTINSVSFQLIFLRRFIFIFVLCLLFDVRDINADRQENISTLAIIIGTKKAYQLCYFLLLIFLLLSIVHFIESGNSLHFIAMASSSIFTFISIEVSKKNNSDYVYLGLLDGMMLLQALLVIITSI